MYAALLKIDLNNKPQSVQKQAYELKVLKTIQKEVLESIQNFAESLSMMQNSSQFLFSCANCSIKIWSVDLKMQ